MRRARRLLRWYPAAWRERYGEEFADHLEQEFSDRPIDLSRGVNVAYKGLIARFDDLGLSNRALGPSGQSRAALGTSFALITLLSVIALNYWSRAMLMWSTRQYHPIPVDATTGILTVATWLLVLMLVAVVLVVLVSAVRQVVRGRGGPDCVALDLRPSFGGLRVLHRSLVTPSFGTVQLYGPGRLPVDSPRISRLRLGRYRKVNYAAMDIHVESGGNWWTHVANRDERIWHRRRLGLWCGDGSSRATS